MQYAPPHPFAYESKGRYIPIVDKLIRWLTIGGIVVGIGILLIGFLTNVSPTNLELISHSFSNIFIGLGGLFATAGGLTVVAQYLDSQKIRRKIEFFKLEYPENTFGTDLQVINTKSHSNKLYLLIKRNNVVKWIGNRETYHDLWFNKMNTITVEDVDFAKYKEGEVILTQGIPGT